MLKVFISATNEEALTPYREAAERVCNDLDLVAVTQQKLEHTSDPTVELCKKAVQDCDIFLILFGREYGSIAPDSYGRSFTHIEFITAVEHLKDKRLIHRFVIERDQEYTSQGQNLGEELIGARGKWKGLYTTLAESNVGFLADIDKFTDDIRTDLARDIARLGQRPDPIVSQVDQSSGTEGTDPPLVSTQPGGSAVNPPSAAAEGAGTGWTQIARGARSWRVSVAAERLTFVPHDLRKAAPTPLFAESTSAAVSDDGRVAGLIVDGILRLSWINRYNPEWKPWFDSTDRPVLDGESELRLLAVAMFGQDGVRCMVASAKATHEITIVWGCSPIEVELTNETSRAATLAGGMKLWVSRGGQLHGWVGPDLQLDEVTSLDAARGGAHVLVGVAGHRNGQSKLITTFMGLDAPNETARVYTDDLSAPATHLVVVRELDGVAPGTVLATVQGVVRSFSRAR